MGRADGLLLIGARGNGGGATPTVIVDESAEKEKRVEHAVELGGELGGGEGGLFGGERNEFLSVAVEAEGEAAEGERAAPHGVFGGVGTEGKPSGLGLGADGVE